MNDERLETIAQSLADGVYRVDSVIVADAILASWAMTDVIARFEAAQSADPEEATSDTFGPDSSR